MLHSIEIMVDFKIEIAVWWWVMEILVEVWVAIMVDIGSMLVLGIRIWGISEYFLILTCILIVIFYLWNNIFYFIYNDCYIDSPK